MAVLGCVHFFQMCSVVSTSFWGFLGLPKCVWICLSLSRCFSVCLCCFSVPQHVCVSGYLYLSVSEFYGYVWVCLDVLYLGLPWWVELCLGLSEYLTVGWSLVRWSGYVQVCMGMYWYVLVCLGVLYLGLPWCVELCLGLPWCVLHSVELCLIFGWSLV